MQRCTVTEHSVVGTVTNIWICLCRHCSGFILDILHENVFQWIPKCTFFIWPLIMCTTYINTKVYTSCAAAKETQPVNRHVTGGWWSTCTTRTNDHIKGNVRWKFKSEIVWDFVNLHRNGKLDSRMVIYSKRTGCKKGTTTRVVQKILLNEDL